jgi:hypothetical protein
MRNSDQPVSVEHKICSPQTLMSGNGLVLAHYVERITQLALTGLLALHPT